MKKAFITGVSRGLGKALALQLLKDNYLVIGLGRSAAEELLNHSHFKFIKKDLLELTDGEQVLTEDVQFDLVILSAGIKGPIKSSKEVSISEIDQVLRVNTYANKILLDNLMTMQPKQVIGISSGAAHYGSAAWLAYSMSKTALNILLRVYSNEFPDCHFASVAPGLVDTDMLQSVKTQECDFEANTKIKAAYQVEQVMDPTEAAKKILALNHKIFAAESGSALDVRTLK